MGLKDHQGIQGQQGLQGHHGGTRVPKVKQGESCCQDQGVAAQGEFSRAERGRPGCDKVVQEAAVVRGSPGRA